MVSRAVDRLALHEGSRNRPRHRAGGGIRLRGERTARALVDRPGPGLEEEKRIVVAAGRDRSRGADVRAAFDEPGSAETFAHHVARSGLA